ncbi:MAG: hypothetical protein ACM3ZR_07295 [Pseudomonadota bacterium]
MQKSGNSGGKFKIADDIKTPSEVYSIILQGVVCALKTIFLNYYVSENIEALMKYINDKRIISAGEYKRLLYEAKDFYPVIISALFINPLKKHTKSFKCIKTDSLAKQELFNEIFEELYVFFNDWLCSVEIDPLLFYRLAISYGKPFSMELAVKQQLAGLFTPIEEQLLKLQMTEIISMYIIDQVAIHLGLAGLDYIDYMMAPEMKIENNNVSIQLSTK